MRGQGRAVPGCLRWLRQVDIRHFRWLVGALLLSPPLWASGYVLESLWYALFYMLLALGCNLITGYCGLCDLGYASRFAIGAYTSAILMTQGWNFWLTLPCSLLVSVLAALLVGLPALRLRSDYLAIVTLGFGEIVRIVARNLSWTGGASGLSGLERPWLLGRQLTEAWMWYLLFLALVALYVAFSLRLQNSRLGRAFAAVREDEDAAAAMGVDVVRCKLLAFVLGAALGGLAGSFYVAKTTAISPMSFPFSQSAYILLAVVLGGRGRVAGVLAGGACMALAPELFRFLGSGRMLVFGILLLVVMRLRPQGLWPERGRDKHGF